MRSLAELRTWLLECASELTSFEASLSRADSPNKRTRLLVGSSTSVDERQERLRALSVRLGLISELLSAQRDGVALVDAETQLFELLLSASLDRLAAMRAALPDTTATSSPIVEPELPLEPPATTPDA